MVAALESAFRDHDTEIKIVIKGDTVAEIDDAARAVGMTAEQWIKSTLVVRLAMDQRQRGKDLGQAQKTLDLVDPKGCSAECRKITWWSSYCRCQGWVL